jgi:Rhodopirellula transposase DDE domain
VTAALAANQPVIAVDTKKKALVGNLKNNGREWRPKGSPEEVRVHDFPIKELGCSHSSVRTGEPSRW